MSNGLPVILSSLEKQNQGSVVDRIISTALEVSLGPKLQLF